MILRGHCIDVMRGMDAESVQCVVTSPPYWQLRTYGTAGVTWQDGWCGELGREDDPRQYVAHLIDVMRGVRRILRPDGTLWVNLGDTYSAGIDGVAAKSLVGIPWRFALAMIDDGWVLRQDVIWHKSNPMPESVTDRCTKAHEYVFLFARQSQYYWDADAMQEDGVKDAGLNAAHSKWLAVASHNGGRQGSTHSGLSRDHILTGRRNRRSVWTTAVGRATDAHFAAFPEELVRPMILASTRPQDTVCDPFGGTGTTAATAIALGRRGIAIELQDDFATMAEVRLARQTIGLPLV